MIKGEHGYTLMEMLLTIAITGLIFVAAGSAMYQLSTVSGYGNDRLTVVHEIQNAAFWFNKDGQEAKSASVNGDLILAMPGNTTVSYGQVGSVLQRTAGVSTLVLAQNVSNVNFSIQNNIITMNIVSTLPGRWEESVQGSYQVHLRLAN